MAKFDLEKLPVQTLEANIGGTVYAVPLAGSLSVKTLKGYDFNSPQDTMRFFQEYIPETVIGDLTQAEYNTIVNAWVQASKEQAGISVGE